MNLNKGGRVLGFKKETQAAAFLCKNGARILATNFRSKLGEIDIIGLDSGFLFFGEVKYRYTMTSGFAEEAVDIKKQKKICRTADYYRIVKGCYDDIPVRYDVIAIGRGNIKWYKNAFEHIFVK